MNIIYNVFTTIKQYICEKRIKMRCARQDNDRVVSAATTRALRSIAHQRFNDYNTLLTHNRRFQ